MRAVDCGYEGAPAAQALLTHYGPSLWVNIGFDPAYRPDVNAAPIAGISNVEALVDTGADESCIDSLLAGELNLPIVDQRVICGATGTKPVNMHLAQVHIPALRFTQYGIFAAVDLVAFGQRHRALIGRTFLRYFRMIYDGPRGAVKISHEPA